MELELGLKITQTKGDLTSTTSFQMAKDPSGPIFMSTETDSKFILTAHLKGFGKEHIGIKINEEGSEIVIRMEKAVQEMVMSGWMVHKKQVEMKGYVRVFRIPSCVDLDRIKAKFNGRDSVLTIVMPKSGKGIRGLGIEEVIREEIVGETSGASLQNKFDKSSEIVEESNEGMSPRKAEFEIESSEYGNTKDRLNEKAETKLLDDVLKTNIEEMPKESSEHFGGEDETVSSEQVTSDRMKEEKKKKKKKHFQLCKPCVIAGSSIIVTLVVIAIHWIRSSSRKKQLH